MPRAPSGSPLNPEGWQVVLKWAEPGEVTGPWVSRALAGELGLLGSGHPSVPGQVLLGPRSPPHPAEATDCPLPVVTKLSELALLEFGC